MKKAARKKKESFFEQVTEEIKEDVKEVVEASQSSSKRQKLMKNKALLIGIFFVVIIIMGALATYLSITVKKDTSKGGELNSQEVQGLIKEVGEKIMIPEGETPTIATVTDKTKLEGQPFFRNAENGDKVMIFGSTQQAILYRPFINKIIAVAPINGMNITSPTPAGNAFPSTSASPAPSATPSQAPEKIKVVVLNSTTEAGLAKKGADLLDAEKVEVLRAANAQGEYDKTTISSVGSRKLGEVELKAIGSSFTKVKVTVTDLPSDEVAPAGADIVVVLGSDFSEAY